MHQIIVGLLFPFNLDAIRLAYVMSLVQLGERR